MNEINFMDAFIQKLNFFVEHNRHALKRVKFKQKIHKKTHFSLSQKW